MLSAILPARENAYYDFDDFDCRIYNESPRQGDAVFFVITPKNGAVPDKIIIDEERELFFLPFNGRYISLFATDFRQDAKNYSISIVYESNSKRSTRHILINFAKREFDVWMLPKTIPRAQTRTEEEIENRKREVRNIYNSIKPVTPKLYILDGYTSPIKDAGDAEYRSFGQKRLRNGEEVSRHKGVDISRPRGTPVFAPLSGKAVLTGNDYFYEGNILIIDNGLGIYSLFCHLDRFAVKEGDIVASGDIIGYVGSTGRSTGPHLHWQVKFLLKDIYPLSFSFINELIEDIIK